MMTSPCRLAVDIGGTFTDIVLELEGRLLSRKVLTTVARPEEAVLEGSRALLAEAGKNLADVQVFVHGTTLATNAVLERRGAATALITTRGFRDVIEIGTEGRYDQYDLEIEKRLPLVGRAQRHVVDERVDADGNVLLPLDEAGLREAVLRIVEAGIESVAICFLHSYANPSHELRARELVRELAPELSVTLSCEVCPEIREYERTSTAVANAYVQPLIDGYLERMAAAFAAERFSGPIYLVTSSGGLTSIETARKFPVRLIESGPAGGAIFAADTAARAAERRTLSFDMGGTTAKVCLIDDFEPRGERVYEVDRAARFLKNSGLPLRIPVIDLVEIGAGGGSIAHLNAIRSVEVGPESAGSEPGPACYGLGGVLPTVTDADVALGLVDPAAFAGGQVSLDVERSQAALSEHIGGELGMSPQMAAYAVYEMVCESMASAARVHAVEKGRAAADYTLIAFGGAAPLHAARVAEKVGIRRVIVPPNAGVGSAVGFLKAPVSYEVVRTRHMNLAEPDAAAVSLMLDEMTAEAKALVESGAMNRKLDQRRLAYMRYVGQGSEIGVQLPATALSSNDIGFLRQAFELEYARLYNRVIPHAAIEVMSWSVTVSTEALRPLPQAPIMLKPRHKAIASRRPYFDGRRSATLEIAQYDRADLAPGDWLPGPAVIVERETTTYVSASFDAHVDTGSNIVMQQKMRQAATHD